MNTTIQNTTKYKNSPLGLIPEDWEVKKLGEIGELKNGINKDKEEFGFGFPMINLMDVFGINKVFENNLNLTLVNATDRDIRDFSLKRGDVLFIRSSVKPIGVGLTTLICDDLENTTYSGFIIRFRDNDYFNLEFKAHCFYEEGFRQRLLNKSTISANTNINQVALKSLSLAIPSLPEQTAIANCLSIWDKAITTQTQLIERKELSKKALMQQLFSGKQRLKGFGDEWKQYHLGDIFTERLETGYLDLMLLSIGASGIYPQSEAIKKDSSNEDKSKYKRICIDDIGYNTMRMWQGRSALSSLEGIVSPAYTVIKPNENTNSLYFSYLFKTPKLMNLFWRNSQGLVDDTLNCKYKDFSKIKYYLPELEEQTAIANLLQCADEEIQILKKKLQQLKDQKKGLMQVLLTGKKRLNY